MSRETLTLLCIFGYIVMFIVTFRAQTNMNIFNYADDYDLEVKIVFSSVLWFVTLPALIILKVAKRPLLWLKNL